MAWKRFSRSADGSGPGLGGPSVPPECRAPEHQLRSLSSASAFSS
jgi:hypothetical protein